MYLNKLHGVLRSEGEGVHLCCFFCVFNVNLQVLTDCCHKTWNALGVRKACGPGGNDDIAVEAAVCFVDERPRRGVVPLVF